MEAVAKITRCPMSVRKMRLVVDLIRGKGVEEALNVLRYTNKEAAVWLEKLVLAAVANWEYKTGMTESADDYDLIISRAFADQGPMLKRFRPAPQGRAHRIRKHSTHVTLVVDNQIALPSDQEDGSDMA
ncbi:MAG: 50S ribosomal protein L22, partial [Saprospiraceae bacterium]|nr:50S ribosomal protein L22 [Saprospiraceae bacterium]